MLDSYTNFVGQTIKIFVPAVGIVQGVVQSVSGDPKGAAKILVPGIGVVEGVASAGSDVWQATGGLGGVLNTQIARNVGFSFGTLALVGGIVVLVILAVRDR